MHSMTGFGQASAETLHVRVSVTLRSVNHRFLDLALRLREDQRHLEATLRERLGAQLSRGRVEFLLDAQPVGAAEASLAVDQTLAAMIGSAAAPLLEAGVISQGPTFGDLLRLPDALRIERATVTWDESAREALWRAVETALEELVEARVTEGAALESVLRAQIGALDSLTSELREAATSWPETAAANLESRIASLLDDADAVDPGRLAQEVAILADRSDVREELDRLDSHLEHFRSLMAGKGAVGKKLDFLAQEIFRELNTTGAKCRDAAMTRLVLDGKSRCEQIREQVQNVE